MSVRMYILARLNCQETLFSHPGGTTYMCPVLVFLPNCLLWLL